MDDCCKSAVNDFELYVNSFSGLTPEQQKNFLVKKDHTLRVLANTKHLVGVLNLAADEEQAAVVAAVFHDIGRFRQIAEYNTLNDAVSMDHATLSVEIIKDNQYCKNMPDELLNLAFSSILLHNKYELPRNLIGSELLLAKLLRDADKIDILKVLTNYYSSQNQPANHMLTWDLPKSPVASAGVVKEILSGKMVTKKEVKNETDIKIMQLSWIYDINFKPSVDVILHNRYLEKIYNSLPKNDQVFEIYRKIKIFAENKMME